MLAKDDQEAVDRVINHDFDELFDQFDTDKSAEIERDELVYFIKHVAGFITQAPNEKKNG